MKIFNCVLLKLFVLNNNTWNHLTVGKQMSSDSLKNSYQQTIHLKIIHVFGII